MKTSIQIILFLSTISLLTGISSELSAQTTAIDSTTKYTKRADCKLYDPKLDTCSVFRIKSENAVKAESLNDPKTKTEQKSGDNFKEASIRNKQELLDPKRLM
ncbi:MAG: hypothetical protein IPH88_07655 [Bacteroidales bacterium]|nr:hypothetical protein [Bacteroidales bacterium]